MAVVEGWFAAGPKPRRGGAPHEVILHVSTETLRLEELADSVVAGVSRPADGEPGRTSAAIANVGASGGMAHDCAARHGGVPAEPSSCAVTPETLMKSETAPFVEAARNPRVSAETLDDVSTRDALVERESMPLVRDARGTNVSAGTLDDASFRDSPFVNAAGGVGVSAETARRLCCDASVSAVLEDGRGQVLDVGRKRRTVPAAIARALEAREGRVCSFPGCTHTLFVDKHHIQHWADGGSTSLDNLCQLCRHHHTFVHEHGWSVERTTDGLKFRTPRGRVVVATPEPPTMTQGALHAMVADAGLDREDVSLQTEGWGDPVDYVQVIDALLRETLLERSATMVALTRARSAAG